MHDPWTPFDSLDKLRDFTFHGSPVGTLPRVFTATKEVGHLTAADDVAAAVGQFVTGVLREAAVDFEPVPYRLSTFRCWVTDDDDGRLLHVAVNALEARPPDDELDE